MLTFSLAAGVPPGIIGLAVNAVNKYIFLIKYCNIGNPNKIRLYLLTKYNGVR